MLDFAREFLPDDFDEVRYIFGKRGAYQKFRALLARRKAVDRWHDFKLKATEPALRDWCEFNSIAFVTEDLAEAFRTLPGAVGAVVIFCSIAFAEGRIIEVGRILHDRMDLRRHLPVPTDESG